MELIKMVTEEISINKIDITTDCTIFAKNDRMIYPNIKELDKEVKALRKELKARNVSLGKSDTLKILKESEEEYNLTVKDYNDTFNQYLVAWSNKLHTGLYTGYGDDEYYTEVIRPLNFKLQKFNHRDTILAKIQYIKYRVDEINNDLKENREFTKVHV
jgi:hypothetical protein